jgi:hypothetical protein
MKDDEKKVLDAALDAYDRRAAKREEVAEARKTAAEIATAKFDDLAATVIGPALEAMKAAIEIRGHSVHIRRSARAVDDRTARVTPAAITFVVIPKSHVTKLHGLETQKSPTLTFHGPEADKAAVGVSCWAGMPDGGGRGGPKAPIPIDDVTEEKIRAHVLELMSETFGDRK